MIVQHRASVTSYDQVADNVFTLRFHAPRIASETRAGQFLNIRPDIGFDPLLRRAYSVHRVIGQEVEIIFNVVGRGSAMLAERREGDVVDILGPLGVPFHLDGTYRRAVLVSGGVGIAPMPILSETLLARGVEVVNLFGARCAAMIPGDGRLPNARYATDDGSQGMRGTVVDLLAAFTDENGISSTRVFACGPNPMLLALGAFCRDRSLPLEVSLECQMACGIGICQGCPVEMRTGSARYTLVCTHGPNYDFEDIMLESIPSVH